jgi:Pentapeptide repeats (8 copies)
MENPWDLSTIWIGRGILLTFAVAMFIATWAAWPNLIIDCGREMYVPAAMAQGKQLYRDLWYPYGPLAPVVNAGLFRVFGIHLNTLYFAGLAVFTGSALVLQSIALRFIPPVAALICSLGFLAPGFHSNFFNEILPYSCAATMGALLCLLTLLYVLRYLERRAGPNLILAGVFACLAVVAKQEFVLPCGLGLAAGVLFRAGQENRFWRSMRTDSLALLPGIALGGAVYGWIVYRYGLDFLVHANWVAAPGSYLMQRYGAFWMHRTGLRLIPAETVKLVFHALIAMSAWWVLAFLLNTRRYLTAAAASLLIAFLGSSFANVLHFVDHPVFGEITVGRLAHALRDDLVFPQGMFLIVLAFAAFLVIRALAYRQMPPAPLAPLIVVIAMGLTLALRVVMEIHPDGYAIYSSSILYLTFVVLLRWIVDGVSPDANLHGANLRGADLRGANPHGRSVPVAAYFAIYAVVFARMAWPLYQGTPWPLIHTPLGDVRRTPDHTALVTQFLPVLLEAKRRGERVLLLPEMAGLYFIAGMQSPSRYEVLLPGVLEPGKYTDIYLRELESRPPDMILLSNRRYSEYGVDYFGLDYDREVLEWIESRYTVVGEIGHFERREGAPVAALIYKPRIL